MVITDYWSFCSVDFRGVLYYNNYKVNHSKFYICGIHNVYIIIRKDVLKWASLIPIKR